MDVPCKVQDDIHLFGLSHNMCLGFWVHITMAGSFLFFYKKAYNERLQNHITSVVCVSVKEAVEMEH